MLVRKVGGNQTHTAIDIETNSTGRNDAGFGVHRRDTADRKTVAPMPVGHTIRIFEDAGKFRDVGRLFKNGLIHTFQ